MMETKIKWRLGKSRSVKTRCWKTKTATVYKIGENVKFFNGQRSLWGSYILCKKFDKYPYKLKLEALFFSNGKFNKPEFSFTIVYKNGSLNVYYNLKETWRCKSLTHNIVFFLKMRKTSQARRLAKIVNEFLKEQGDKRRITLKDVTLQNINGLITQLCYPAAKNLPKVPHYLYSAELKKDIGLKKICKRVFGKIGKMPKLVSENQDILLYGSLWKGLIPFDYFLKKNYTMDDLKDYLCDSPGIFKKNFRKLVSQFSEPRRIVLFKENHDRFCGDCIRMFKNIPNTIIPKGIKTWKEIHDFLMIEYKKFKLGNKEIKYSDIWNKIDGEKLGEFTIQLPRDSYTLIEWGQRLNNCIGSYAEEAISGRSRLFSLYEDGEVKYNGEINHSELVQLVSDYNARASKELWQNCIDFFNKYGIVK